MPPLPQELVDLVVDHLSDDWRALAACAQAHPDLAPRARSRLQGGTIRLAVDSPNCSDIDDFLRIFSTSSSLITAVCAVSICGRPTTQAASLSESRLPLPTTLIALQHFDHLRSLALRSLIVADYLLFVVFFTQCKSLEALDLESLSIAPADIAEVILYCPPAVLAYNLQIDRWNETILGMADSLADLSVTLPIPLDQFSLYWTGTQFPSVIVHCHRLRRLVIRYEPVTAGHDNRALFVSALAALFATAPAVARRPDPDPNSETGAFQLLEVFTAVLPEPHGSDVPGYERELARLACVLVNVAFPALARVRVGLEGGSNVPAQGTVERTDAPLEPLRALGIATEVAGFRADEWEAWCMALPVGAAQ